MNNCEDLGYKVGDLFEVTSNDGDFFSCGSIVELCKDDGSTIPQFKLVSGYCREFDNKSFFHLRNVKPLKIDLQTINSPFGELDKQTKKDLLCAWVDGADIEFIDVCRGWTHINRPSWGEGGVYRVKPTLSAKDATKAKLILEAQQQLRDAQEALDKAQQL